MAVLPTAQEPRCATCRFFGRTVFADREPSGQCQKNAPDEYQVLRVRTLTGNGDSALSIGTTITTPFPAVWPSDKCGEYQPTETL